MKVPRECVYMFPSHGLAGHDPEDLLNHRLGSNGKLLPDGDLDGLLLGVGQASIPEQYKDRQAVSMRLSVIDQRGNSYGMSVKFMVHRGKQCEANLESDLAARAVYSAKESKGASPREKSE